MQGRRAVTCNRVGKHIVLRRVVHVAGARCNGRRSLGHDARGCIGLAGHLRRHGISVSVLATHLIVEHNVVSRVGIGCPLRGVGGILRNRRIDLRVEAGERVARFRLVASCRSRRAVVQRAGDPRLAAGCCMITRQVRDRELLLEVDAQHRRAVTGHRRRHRVLGRFVQDVTSLRGRRVARGERDGRIGRARAVHHDGRDVVGPAHLVVVLDLVGGVGVGSERAREGNVVSRHRE